MRRGRTARDDERIVVLAIARAERDAAELEHREHVGVRELELEREADDVELAERLGVLERDERQASPSQLRLHVDPRRVATLGERPRVVVQDFVEDLEPEVAHPDVVDVREGEADARADALRPDRVPVFRARAVLAAQVAGGFLNEVDEICVRVQGRDSGIFRRMTPVRAPWDGQTLGEVELADAACAERAVVNARRAYDAIRAMPSWRRRDALRKIARTIESRSEELSKKLALEAGKPIVFARAEVARAVSTFDVAAEEATRIEGHVMPLDITQAGEGYTGTWQRVPRGPVVAISPFNFPLNLVAHKVAPALACGASIVLKPAPQTPLIALELEAIVRGSGFPDDALRVLPCDVAVAESLVRDDRFATLSFTGSAAVGWHLKSIAGKKRVLLELGGNAAAIVHDDADLAFAAQRITSAAFGYAGQVCIKVQRLYVHAPIAETLVERITHAAQALAPRAPLEDGILSCLIDEKSAVRIRSWTDEAKQRGARALVDSERDGNKLAAIVLAFEGDGRGARVVDEEVFGPVLTVHRYETFDDALAMADDTRYGLQAGLFTDSRARVERAFERLHVGGLIVGDAPSFRVDSMPYGGTRDSGLGREGVRFAIEEMTEHKLLVSRRADGTPTLAS